MIHYDTCTFDVVNVPFTLQAYTLSCATTVCTETCVSRRLTNWPQPIARRRTSPLSSVLCKEREEGAVARETARAANNNLCVGPSVMQVSFVYVLTVLASHFHTEARLPYFLTYFPPWNKRHIQMLTEQNKPYPCIEYIVPTVPGNEIGLCKWFLQYGL